MIRFFALHSTAANLLMLLLLAIGLVNLPGLKRETFPDFASVQVEIRVPYPGASAEDVEDALCLRLEDALEGLNDLYEVRCEARESIAIAVAEMAEGGSFARFLDDVKTEVEAIDDFPEQVEQSVIQQLARTDRVVSIAVTGPMEPRDLKHFAQELKERLRQLPEVSQVTISGFSDNQFRVQTSREVLLAYGVSMSDLADAIARQSLDLPAGSIETRDQDILIRFTDQRRSVQELEQLVVVGGFQGGEVRLGEVATIRDRFELDEDRIEVGGRRAALLEVDKTKQQDTLKVMNAVERFLERERRRAPPGVELTLTQNVSSIVSDRLRMLTTNGVQGLVLVFLTMWLFFRLRFAFWVAMGLPVAFLGGLFFMSLAGVSINMISMVALLIALGLLMDDAIVISENIATRLRQGMDPLNAAIEGTRQVAPGVIASFLTTVAVFGPLAFLAGDMGKVLRVIPVVLILVLAVSLVEAFCILPHHLGHALAHPQGERSRRWRGRFNDAVDRVRDRLVGRAVDALVSRRYLFLGSVMSLLLVCVGLLAGGTLKFRAFPEIEGDVIEARLLLPQGTPLERTEAVVARITSALHQVDEELSAQQPEGRRLVQQVSVRYNLNQDAFESGPHVATVSADLLTAESRRGSVDQVINRWRELTGSPPDVISLNFKEPAIGPAGRPIEIRLGGRDLERLKAASLELQDWLGRYRGVLDLSDDLRPGKPEVRLRLKEGATSLGLNASLIARQLRDAFYGSKASEFQVGRESYEIDVRLRDRDKASLRDLYDFRVITTGGHQVPVSAVAEVVESRGFARIQRIDGVRTVTIRGDLDDRLANASEIIRDTRARFLPELKQRYPDLQIQLEGQSKESAATGGSMLRGFALGLLGIFLLLSFQFRSFLEPLVVIAAIPLAFIGVILGHLVMGLELSMPSMMGFVSLAGVVVNDSILLVEFLKLRVQEGQEVAAAARQASRERFRAVLLTSATTIAGLLPLLAERSLQAQVLIPLATSIVFGLLASTLLVLFVVPALFGVFADLGLTSAAKIRAEFETPGAGPAAAVVQPED